MIETENIGQLKAENRRLRKALAELLDELDATTITVDTQLIRDKLPHPADQQASEKVEPQWVRGGEASRDE